MVVLLGVQCPSRATWLQFYYGFYALLSLVSTGMNLGYSSVALPLLTSNETSLLVDFEDYEANATWFASIISIAVPIGCVCSIFTMRAGRKKALFCGGAMYTLGWIVIATSNCIPQLLVGRFINGFAMGLAATAAPVYVAEIATPAYKTTLTAWTNIFICIGIMIIYVLGNTIPTNWKIIAGIAAIIPAYSALTAIFWLPESPRWLLLYSRQHEAKLALLRLRGLRDETPEFNDEFNTMILSHAKSEIIHNNSIAVSYKKESFLTGLLVKIRNFWRISKKPDVWKPFFILNAYFFFQQFCGIYVIIGYSVNLITDSGITVNPLTITVIIGVIQIVAGLVLVWCSSRLGRRPLSIISGVGMAVSIAALAIYLHLRFFKILDERYSVIPLVSIFVFVAAGSFGFQALPWAMIGELYPTKFVHVLGPITTCLEGIFSFLSLQLYPVLVNVGFIETIYFYTIVSIIATVFIYLTLPETHESTENI